MIKYFFSLVFIFFLCYYANGQIKNTLNIGMGKTALSFTIDDKGTPVYAVSFNNKPVINSSKLGFALKNMNALDAGFEITKTDTLSVDETWQPVWGEVKNIRNHYKQLSVHLRQKPSSILTRSGLDVILFLIESSLYRIPLSASGL